MTKTARSGSYVLSARFLAWARNNGHEVMIEELDVAADLRRFNHWFVLTLRAAAQIAAGIGNNAGAVWTSDGTYTFWQLGASERGTGATPAYRDFEVELAINGNELQNRPVSARAMSAASLGTI